MALEAYPGSRAFLGKIIGYSEALACIDGKLSLEEAAAETRKRTRRFAKRQLTWLRAVEGAVWLDAGADGGRAADYLLAKGLN
jgi:tRNA dimethylallyltransferase